MHSMQQDGTLDANVGTSKSPAESVEVISKLDLPLKWAMQKSAVRSFST